MKTRPPTLAEVREAEVREEEVLAEVQAGFEQLDKAEVSGIGPKVITWTRLQEETKASLKGLVDLIQGESEEWPQELSRIAGYRDNLSVVDGVAMFRDRPVIPPSLRPEVLATLHSGHQGVWCPGPSTQSGGQGSTRISRWSGRGAGRVTQTPPASPRSRQLLSQASSTPSSRSVQTISPLRPGSIWS